MNGPDKFMTRPKRPPGGVLGPALILLFAVLAVYLNSMGHPFIYDDLSNIVGNDSIRSVNPLGGALRPPPSTGLGGRPIVNFSLAVNYALGGLDPWGYHLVNILLHALSALVLWALLRASAPERGALFALGAALIWAVHPLHSQAVNVVTQRSEILAGLLILTTVYAAARGWNSRHSLFWHSPGRPLLPVGGRRERDHCGGSSSGLFI